MAVKMRLTRMGAHKKPMYRIVVADARNAATSKSIADIGTYNPNVDPAEVKVDVEAAQKWIKNGAQPTDTVKALLVKNGAIEEKKAAKKTTKKAAPKAE